VKEAKASQCQDFPHKAYDLKKHLAVLRDLGSELITGHVRMCHILQSLICLSQVSSMVPGRETRVTWAIAWMHTETPRSKILRFLKKSSQSKRKTKKLPSAGTTK
jgi:hypothetical protein